jgi:hypothetical protein
MTWQLAHRMILMFFLTWEDFSCCHLVRRLFGRHEALLSALDGEYIGHSLSGYSKSGPIPSRPNGACLCREDGIGLRSKMKSFT